MRGRRGCGRSGAGGSADVFPLDTVPLSDEFLDPIVHGSLRFGAHVIGPGGSGDFKEMLLLLARRRGLDFSGRVELDDSEVA